MKKRILSIVLAICLVLTLVPTTVFADGDSHTVTVNAGEGGKVSTDGTSWSNSVSVKVDDGETLDGKVQYKADEGYAFDSVLPKIVSVAAGGSHTVLLDAKGNVWTAGNNGYGQLGRKTSSDSDSTFKPVTVGNGVKIKAISGGASHTVLLDEDGNVWTAGENYYGQLGRKENSGERTANSTFTQVTDGMGITAIAAGSFHTVLLDEDGNVWTAGWNLYGQLGRNENKNTNNPNPTFTQVTDGIVITAIVAGDNHTVLLDESNNVWTAGENVYGQLGITGGNISTFTQATDDIEITAIAAGGYHTVLLDANDNVWTAGWNRYGQLGRDENKGTNNANPTFTQVTNGISGVKIKAISAGASHTVLLDESNNVWTAGMNYYGQLGRDENKGTFNPNPTFKQVTDGMEITAIAASRHTVLLDEKGNVWTAGWNSSGQLGRDENVGTNNANPTFKQSPVNQDAITFDEFVNIPIHNSSVFIVKFKDVQKPVITGLENNKTYCDTVEFTVTDNDGIASVTANNVELTATNGKYTLEKGMGTVKVVATDNSGNETSVTVTVNNGHTDTAPKDHICDVCGETFSSHTGGTATYFKKAVCEYCKEEYGDLLTDETAPTGEISIGTNKWNSFLNTITFGIFFKDTQSVTITASDDSYSHNGYTNDKAVKVEYYLYSSDTALTEADLAGETFIEYNDTFSINPDNKYVVYAKLTDHAGNVTYISSNGVVLDATAPVITGVTDGAVYYTTQKAVVTDDNLKSVTLNGVSVGTTVTLNGNTDEVYTIVATDKSNNSKIVTVTMKSISSIAESIDDVNGENVKSSDKEKIEAVKESVSEVDISNATDSEKEALNDIDSGCDQLLDIIDKAQKATETENIKNVENISPDNVTKADREALEKAKTDLEKALEDYGTNYTDEEKAKIQSDLERVDESLKVLDDVKAVEDIIAELPDSVEPDDLDTVESILDATDAYNALTDYEKSLVSEDAKEKLDTLIKGITAYIFYEGSGGIWTIGQDGTLTFTANGAYSKFTGIKVDGEDVDESNYTAKSGSTIITLNADYLDTLSVGTHTLTVLYTDGEAEAEFEVKEEPPETTKPTEPSQAENKEMKSPETGNDEYALYLAMLFALCGAGIITTSVYSKKKKHS